MTDRSTSPAAPADGTAPERGWFLYGLVPDDVEATSAARGLDESLGPVTVLSHDGIGALVSEIPLDVRLGLPEQLVAYKELLDATALAAPVLPVRFGTVLTSPEAVTELLAAGRDEYRAALEELEGRVEYLVRARYDERAVLTEVLEQNSEAARLREQLRGQPEETGMDLRIRLGEILSQEVEARRAADTERLVQLLGPVAVAHVPQSPLHEQDAANVAFLVDEDRRADFERAVDGITDEWRDRATVRLVGPLAAYDFAGGTRPRG
ncbi:GvpL/GvpF family gas vesicle protein [Micromonospora sp. NPDC049559]|uniref:GvpL/GvpF family gas vesicle protein n=1 Tax=Micromonospora sp. NPDC049559 TaxID=3155923 RepID=UPI00342CB23F